MAHVTGPCDGVRRGSSGHGASLGHIPRRRLSINLIDKFIDCLRPPDLPGLGPLKGSFARLFQTEQPPAFAASKMVVGTAKRSSKRR